MERFALLAETYGPPPREPLARLFREALGLHPSQANQRARTVRGILAEGLSREEAERIARGMAEADFPLRVAPEEVLPPSLEGRRNAREARMGEEGLFCRFGLTGPGQVFSWEGIRLLGAGVVPEETAGGFRSGGSSGAGGVGVGTAVRLALDPVGGAFSLLRKSRARRKETTPSLPGLVYPQVLADLFFRPPGENGGGLWIRLPGREIESRAAWEEGSRREWFPAFRDFLSRCARKLGPDRISPAARVLLAGGGEAPPSKGPAHFGRELEFRLYNRWILACVLLGGA